MTSNQAKQPSEYPCPACYRPGPAKGYCERCLQSGAADRHAARQGHAPATAAKPRQPRSTAPAKRQAAPPTLPDRRRAELVRETRRRMAEEAGRDPAMSVANRTTPGTPAHRQSPARDAALPLLERPGEPVVLNTYASPPRVKAAIHYLRYHCHLPPGFRFWRQGCDLMAVYDPAGTFVVPGARTPRTNPSPPADPRTLTRQCTVCGTTFDQASRHGHPYMRCPKCR